MNKPPVVKTDLINAINSRLGLNQRESKDFVDNFFEEIRCELERGKDVKLSGFGRFMLRRKPPRPGRNPKTGVDVIIKERTVVTFRASNMLRARTVDYNPSDDEI